MQKDNIAVTIALTIMIPLCGFLLARAASEDKVRDPEITIIERPRNEIQLGALTGELDPATAERLIQDPDRKDSVYAKAETSGQE